MDKISARIKALFDEADKTYQELERATGIAKSSLQRYASGATSKIPLEAIKKIAHAFGVSPAYLMGWEQEPEELADITAQVLLQPTTLAMVEQYLQLSESDQYTVRLMVASLAEKTKLTDAHGVSPQIETVSVLETE